MAGTFLLIDFENVRDFTLSDVPDDWQVQVFVGRSQNSIPFDLVAEAQKVGDRLNWVKIGGDGHNNLDFHIAHYLGVLRERHASANFVILSKDKGFDSLVRHIVAGGTSCERVSSLENSGLRVSKPTDANDNFDRVLTLLRNVDKKCRPRRRKTLLQFIASVFQKKLPQTEVDRIASALFAKDLVKETDNALSYHLEPTPPPNSKSQKKGADLAAGTSQI